MRIPSARVRCILRDDKAHGRGLPLGVVAFLALVGGPMACSSSTPDTGGGASGTPSSSSGAGGGAITGSSSGTAGSGAAGNAGGGADSGSGNSGATGGSSGDNQTTPGPSGSSGSGALPSGSSSGSAGNALSDAGSGSTSAAADAGSDGGGGVPDQSALPAVTIHLAGDSTMSNYTAATTQEGWGQELGQYFISKVTIDNQALPGANIEAFYGSRWKTLIANVKAGDYVMAAFGINDSGTTHGPVAPAAFQTQMGVMATEVSAKKATFIPTTSSPLQVWVGGVETNTRLQPYCDATLALGMMKGLLVDDLNARAVAYYTMIGQTAAAALTFNGDKAHFDKQGATEMALLASQELARIKSPLAAYLK